MTTCYNCNEEIHPDEARFYSTSAYCEACFDDLFTYCDQCDCLIERDRALHDSDGSPFCEECYYSNYDDDIPSNPYVDQSDRDIVIKLCRNWIFNKQRRMPISINKEDVYLKEIREAVGLCSRSIYVYGLVDRDEYQIKATSDLFPIIEAFVQRELPDYSVLEEEGNRRLGLSLDIRKNHFGLITKLIKEELCAE